METSVQLANRGSRPTAKARETLDALAELAKRRYVPPDNQAIIYIGLGDKDQAFSWLQTAVEDRSEWLCKIKVDPVLDPLRSDSRFMDLLKLVNSNLQQEAIPDTRAGTNASAGQAHD